MAKPDLDLSVLRTWLLAHFDGLGELEPLAEGEESRAYAFTATGGDFVVRINASPTGFEKDRLAFLHLNTPLVPIPEVMLIAPLTANSHGCVSRRLPGQTLQALPDGDAYAYGPAVAALLDALDQLDPARLAASGLFARGEQSWPHFLREPESWHWEGLAPGDTDIVRQSLDAIALLADSIPEPRGLVHGDFGSNNVLVTDGVITGLIDWSEAMIGDPRYDLANILFWRPWLDCMEQQCRYFETEKPERLADGPTLACYQLRIGLAVLHEALNGADRTMIDWSLQRCTEILTQHMSVRGGR